jgi:hypothetical protein
VLRVEQLDRLDVDRDIGGDQQRGDRQREHQPSIREARDFFC